MADAALERESSRLLGAAAIGLVGGIAIAASLAVFVINFYGPVGRTAPGAAARAMEAGETGYGRQLRSLAESEPRYDAATAPPPEEAVSITAADIVALPGQPSALAIDLRPSSPSEQALVSITGVPEGARLNAGVDAGGGNWLLPPRRLSGLTINVPASLTDNVVLGVQLLDGNVRTPLSDKKQFALLLSAPKAEASTVTNVTQRVAPLVETPKPALPIAAPFSAPRPSPLLRPRNRIGPTLRRKLQSPRSKRSRLLQRFRRRRRLHPLLMSQPRRGKPLLPFLPPRLRSRKAHLNPRSRI